MFEKFLNQIQKNNLFLIKPLKKNNILQNPVIFGYCKVEDLTDYRYVYLGKLYKNKLRLEKILEKIRKNKSKLDKNHYKILIREIKFIYKKIDFLKNVYDFEANKIDENYKVTFPEFDYDYYNRKFYGVCKKDICSKIKITHVNDTGGYISKVQLKELLDYTTTKVDGFKYRFGSFVFMSHSSGIINIPTKKMYSLREVITLFFHEMTHFFRRYNNIRNYGTNFGFSDYMKLEEGFALYNEYLYGKKLIPGLKYNPYYEACFAVLLDNKLSEKEKKEKIYHILKEKGYDREKSMYYYYRFYRYSSFGSNQFFLKDLVYTKGYKAVKKLINYDESFYDIIFSGKIGINLIKNNIYKTTNSFDTKTYFESIFGEIKNKFGIDI